jgi:hypothetical protein
LASGAGSALVPGKLAAVRVVFAIRFMPNCAVPRTLAPAAAMPAMVFEPEVRVVPFTVIAYPELAFVLAAI